MLMSKPIFQSIKKIIQISLELNYVQVNSKRYHSPGQIFEICKILATRANFVVKCWPLGLPRTLYFDKFYTLAPLSRSNSLSYPTNIYKFVGRTYISINEKYVKS